MQIYRSSAVSELSKAVKTLSTQGLGGCSSSEGISLSAKIERALSTLKQRSMGDKERFTGDGEQIISRRPEPNFTNIFWDAPKRKVIKAFETLGFTICDSLILQDRYI